MDINNSCKPILIPWLSLPVVFVGYSLFWDRITGGIAVHFGPTGEPVSWTSRGVSLLFRITTLLLMLSINSWRLSGRGKNPAGPLMRYYFTVSALTIIILAFLLSNV